MQKVPIKPKKVTSALEPTRHNVERGAFIQESNETCVDPGGDRK